MHNDPQKPVLDALRVLLATCLRAAEERDDVRRSLETLGRWLVQETSGASGGGAQRRGSAQHGVLTPAARVRSDAPRSSDSDARDGEGQRLAGPLATVVTRARWKSSACRLACDRYDALRAGGDAEAIEQLDKREASLRARLRTLQDTSTWMLDMPFGKRVAEAGAFDVEPEAVERLATIATCYETVASAAEVAMELDEAGAFADGPPAPFLYLMAEAQSALLQSLSGAPTRSDSDQRDIFLWLKDQTTRYRIYVDRFMRLDDPADPKSSADLVERLRRASRDILEERKQRRARRDALAKIRYHVRKIQAAESPCETEVTSLGAALEAWHSLGFELNDRKLVEVVDPLYRLSPDPERPGGRALAEVLQRVPARDKVLVPRADPGARAAAGDPERAAASTQDLRRALGSRAVGLLLAAGTEVDADELGEGIGAESLEVAHVDLETEDADARLVALDAFLDSGADVFLLGVKLPQDEYSHLKERCLAMDALFVRLPGALDAAAILHQVGRQVGWRLRVQVAE